MKNIATKAVIIAALALAAISASTASARAQLLRDAFSYPSGLITNEFAHHHPVNPAAKKNANWELTSGSLFAGGGAGWTGAPDDKAVNAASSAGTNSAVFRMNTARKDFGNVSVSFRLLNQGLKTSPSTPAQAWDGAHIWLRYKTQYNLYYASVNRRDNTSIIKKKVPGGPSNGGTYYNLSAPVRHAVPYNRWQNVRADVVTNADGSVSIRLYVNGALIVQAVDDGKVGGAPITGAGGVGIRGDNASLKFDDFVVSALGGGPANAGAPIVSGVRVQNNTAYWTTSEPAASLLEWGLTTAYGSRHQAPALKTSHAMAMAGLVPGRVYNYRVASRNAAGLTSVSGNLRFTASGAAAPAGPALVFSGVGSTNRTASSADIVWTTNVAADSQVDYGLTSSYGLRTPLNTAKLTSHRVRITGLRAGTRYYYRVRSGGKAEAVVHAFTTLGASAGAK